MPVLELDSDQLTKQLREILQSWPLYRRLEYSGAIDMGSVPWYIKLFCPNCNLRTTWETETMTGSRSGTRVRERHKVGFCTKEYKCRNCRICKIKYFFYWEELIDSGSVFYKVGQYPELEERVSESLAKALGPDDLKAYKNALRLRNFNLGIAAVAYMRRVVENRMNDLLDILCEAAITHNSSASLLKRHERVARDKRFSVKIDYAGNLLPRNLRPDGQPNPIAILHELASEGLHAKSDEECVDIFDECRQAFEYVFGKLRIENEDAKKFVSEMTKLVEKKTKKSDVKASTENNRDAIKV